MLRLNFPKLQATEGRLPALIRWKQNERRDFAEER